MLVYVDSNIFGLRGCGTVFRRNGVDLTWVVVGIIRMIMLIGVVVSWVVSIREYSVDGFFLYLIVRSGWWSVVVSGFAATPFEMSYYAAAVANLAFGWTS